jgi:hypothetical protein
MKENAKKSFAYFEIIFTVETFLIHNIFKFEDKYCVVELY